MSYIPKNFTKEIPANQYSLSEDDYLPIRDGYFTDNPHALGEWMKKFREKNKKTGRKIEDCQIVYYNQERKSFFFEEQ